MMGIANKSGPARFILMGAGAALALAIGAPTDAASETPAVALKLAKEYKVSPKLMSRWEGEHKVPAAWLAGAKKEGALKISGSARPTDFKPMAAPFRARYPFIKVNYTRGSRNTRVLKPLTAFRQGRYLTDIVTGINTRLNLFQELDALTDLSDMPNRNNIPKKFGGSATKWIGARLRYYCLVYNTDLVKKSELPKTWDDLKSSKALQNSKTALWYGVGSWLLPLWGEKGPKWTTQFIHDIYGTLKAERRKEGMTSLTSLTGAGEFKSTLAVAAYMVAQIKRKGAPVAFHCPDTVMINASAVGLLKGAPNTNAGKLYLNWLLSMEGQLFQYRHTGGRPIHKALQIKEFLPFPEETLGKTMAFHDPSKLSKDLPALMKIWGPYWEGGSGPKGKRRKRGRRGKGKKKK
ncbi:MAG: ABC transporter substrate-binding protein [Alphaproteobacteria bacterium]